MKIEEQRQLEIEEGERQRLKLLEKMVAEELRGKLMEILGQRAQVSDVRSKDIIEGEKIDLEVREMEEVMRNMEKPEIEVADVEMEESKEVDVSEIDVEMLSENA